MLRMLFALGLLCACGRGQAVDAAAQDEPTLSQELEALFAAAERDPAALVTLVERASARLAELEPGAAHLLADWLEPYCARLYFTPLRAPGMERVGLELYTVQPGDIPARIARRHGFDHPLLARWNERYDPRRIRVGQELKVLDLAEDASLRVVVDRERHRLAAWRVPTGGRPPLLLLYVPVGLGAPETPTPAGTTTVVQRVRDPEWTHPKTGVRYTPRDPGNLLGGYWMRLDPAGLGGREGIGLHGFTGDDPSAWLEKDTSNGCVRLLQDDIDRVFHLAVEGTELRIVP